MSLSGILFQRVTTPDEGRIRRLIGTRYVPRPARSVPSDG